MSIYKKFASNQKIFNSPPTTQSHEQNQWGVFLSKLNIRVYECCDFYAARFLISRYDFVSATLRVARGCRTSCLMAK